MNVTNYLPMQLMSNTMYELYVDFSSTHPKADEWVEKRKQFWRDALGEPIAVLLDALTNYRLTVEGANGDTTDFSDKFKALDELAVLAGKRPPGWVPSGDTKAQLAAPNLSTLLLWLRGGIEEFNKGDDAVSAEVVTRMAVELSGSLPDFGDRAQPWHATIDFENNGYNPEFVPSNVSQHVFMQDNDCDGDPYYVNGEFVQFACPMGYVTVWQGA